MNNTEPSYSETTKVWAIIGALSFGGPAAQISLMHKEIVDERQWLTEQQFLNALAFCMLLPGPEAMQLATYAGWRMQGTWGGLIAGLLFVIPGAVLMLALAGIYAAFGQVPLIEALFLGVKAAVIVVVIEALIKVSKRALHGRDRWIIAALAFVGIFFFKLPYPLIIGAAALYGYFNAKTSPQNGAVVAAGQPLAKTAQTTLLWLVIWWSPLIALLLAQPDSILSSIGLFFSKLAVVTFGGAYAVLAYMGQDVVENSAWLTAGQMMDGLGLAETTPGPLILVTEFVGFLAAHKQGGFWYGTAAALVTLWATFVPCFLWIFVGAPYIEWISAQPRLKSALTAITAAVVGVILNLSIWFALHVFFNDVSTLSIGPIETSAPNLQSLDWRAVVLTLMASFAAFKLKWGIPLVLLFASVAGVSLSFV